MALKGKVTKAERDALSGELQKEYKPLLKDGQPVKDAQGNEMFILDAPDMEHRDDITGLKNALETERAQNTERGQRIATLEAEKATLASDFEAWKKKNPKATNEEIEAAKKELIEKHTKELDAATKKGETYRNHLDRVMRQDAARAAIVAAKGVPELLLPHVLNQTKFVETDDGKFKVVVVNAQGGERIGDSQGNPMTLTQLVEEMRNNEVFGRAFEASNAGGSGANNNNGGGGNSKTMTRTAFEQLPPAQQSSHVKAGGTVTD